MIRRHAGQAGHRHHPPALALPATLAFGVQNKDTPIACFHIRIVLRDSPKGNRVIRQKIAHTAGLDRVGQGNFLLLRGKSGNNACRYTRHRNEKHNDKRCRAGRNRNHRHPTHAQGIKPKAGQRHTIPKQESKQPHDHQHQDGKLDLIQKHRTNKKDCRRQSSWRQRRNRPVILVLQSPCQRQQGRQQQDKEIRGSDRHRHRSRGDQRHQHRQLNIPALPAHGQLCCQ